MANMADTVGNLIRVRCICDCRDQVGINVFHYKVEQATAVGGTTDQQIVNALNNLFGPAYADVLGSVAEFYGVDAQLYDPSLGVLTHTSLPAVAATSDQLPLPLQTSGIIQKNTNFGGPAYRGRAYIPFPSVEHHDVNEKPSVAYTNALTLIASRIVYTGILTVNTTDSFSLRGILWHREHGDPPVPASFTTLTGAQAIRKWAVQTRRGDYGKANALPW